jgi:hypothetical protein
MQAIALAVVLLLFFLKKLKGVEKNNKFPLPLQRFFVVIHQYM